MKILFDVSSVVWFLRNSQFRGKIKGTRPAGRRRYDLELARVMLVRAFQ